MSKIADNVKEIYKKRRALVVALSISYSQRALNLFNAKQGNDEFWNNQTFQAKDSVFAEEINTNSFVGFFIAHAKDYGVFLELKDNRKNEALRPIINALYPDFIKDLKRIYQ